MIHAKRLECDIFLREKASYKLLKIFSMFYLFYHSCLLADWSENFNLSETRYPSLGICVGCLEGIWYSGYVDIMYNFPSIEQINTNHGNGS